MNKELSSFAARLRETISNSESISDQRFNSLALELFALQFKCNSAYRKICEARKLTPLTIEHWTRIPFVPTSTFKELELTPLAPDERAVVFHSSGTTEQKTSRHFHCAESLEIYEASLWAWFDRNMAVSFVADAPSSRPSPPMGEKVAEGRLRGNVVNFRLVALTPPLELASHSSLVHMFEVVRQKIGAPESAFVGKLSADGAWSLDFNAMLAALNSSLVTRHPPLILGTAFSFVHLLDYLAENDLQFELPKGSRVMETGGYKNRSRSLPKSELHALITGRLGVPRENIICEYGMSELSSQAYSVTSDMWRVTNESRTTHHSSPVTHHFQFPPWARAQIISSETGREVAGGETGLIRVLDLANVFSVAAIQTEDLAVHRGDGFEMIGRAQSAEPRGCSLMTA